MTQPPSSSHFSLQVAFPILLFTVFALVFGLWEVRWNLSALPMWYYVYSLLCGVLFAVSVKVRGGIRPEQPFWQRAVIQGFGWGVPVMFALFGPDLLSGEAADAPNNVIHFGVWSVSSLLYGLGMAGMANAKVKDWL